ncbi:surfeit locus protein 1-like [Stylonychia lemnae]|uniref:SURF1-like protein n=1 Tax=Stylonychia lemnae TaxID=5949 RepID=A0A078B542_STYLE|nr:surfeit locus protein 1-like [Stylonychia lemnae]|eukprot:CDW89539.1 surfeit locus protein 1-like [Stylonychia lemnae]
MEYQKRRAEDKHHETERRHTLLKEQALDITPLNGKNFLWTGKNVDQFEDEFSFKKIKVRGIFDHTKEIQVEKFLNGEKGVQIITPFYTHLSDKGEEQAILVNRGWVPQDFKDQRMHYGVNDGIEITGVLYRGDAKTKYSKPNDPLAHYYTRVDAYDFSVIDQLKNWEEASKFMIYQIDENEQTRQVLPSVPTADELTKWRISPQRHEAYANLWKSLTFGGIFANTLLWLYF